MNQRQPRIKVETEAVFAIMALIQTGVHILLNSEALEYEVSRIPNENRRDEVVSVLSLAGEYLELTEASEKLATELETKGVRSMDALHLALASTAEADFFCTCDDQLLRKGRSIPGISCKVVSILSLVLEVTT